MEKALGILKDNNISIQLEEKDDTKSKGILLINELNNKIKKQKKEINDSAEKIK